MTMTIKQNTGHASPTEAGVRCGGRLWMCTGCDTRLPPFSTKPPGGMWTSFLSPKRFPLLSIREHCVSFFFRSLCPSPMGGLGWLTTTTTTTTYYLLRYRHPLPLRSFPPSRRRATAWWATPPEGMQWKRQWQSVGSVFLLLLLLLLLMPLLPPLLPCTRSIMCCGCC